MNKLISIIIINWNGEKWLRGCFRSLKKQSYPNFEIILVDNASSDNSVEFIKKYYPKTKIINNKENIGFAGGNNIGYKHTKGQYILLLNNDTTVEKDFLKNFVKAFDEIPNLGSVQSKIVLMNVANKLDVVGSYWTGSSFLYYYGYGKNASATKYNKSMPFFSNKGASMLIKREVIEKVGLFDDDFWCYYEETDFCHRVWLAGYECWYYPKAVAHHAMGGTSLAFDNSYIQFHNFKNKLLSFLKNFEKKSLMSIIPIYLIINIFLSFTWLLQGKFKHFLALYKSLWWNVIHLRRTLRKRKIIQSHRIISDQAIFKKTKINPKIAYYYFLMKGDLLKFEN
ncbi:MAG TPA: glycosyltransferase family 2 protein [Candidatus Limnocylindrales bacterium]|nr:glycosyltransferase family 2 protein [Candidatus Limnocylindrales bacterium]